MAYAQDHIYHHRVQEFIENYTGIILNVSGHRKDNIIKFYLDFFLILKKRSLQNIA